VVEGAVRIAVRDNGRGISQEMLDRVFDVFVQLGTDIHRPDGGLGVGLAIVRSLVAAHGGTVWATSAGEGSGSEFVVELPLAETVAPAEQRSQDWGVAGLAADILVVDDNHDAADMLAALLQGHGHQVRVVYDGQAALDAFVERPPTLVLLDIGLPTVDGFEVARRVREQFGRGPRLVALSGYGQHSDLERSAASGFDLHLVKPVDIDDILAAIR
jgi:CheY-like chemotaxis protein